MGYQISIRFNPIKKDLTFAQSYGLVFLFDATLFTFLEELERRDYVVSAYVITSNFEECPSYIERLNKIKQDFKVNSILGYPPAIISTEYDDYGNIFEYVYFSMSSLFTHVDTVTTNDSIYFSPYNMGAVEGLYASFQVQGYIANYEGDTPIKLALYRFEKGYICVLPVGAISTKYYPFGEEVGIWRWDIQKVYKVFRLPYIDLEEKKCCLAECFGIAE